MHTGTTNAGKSRTPVRSAGSAAQAAKRPPSARAGAGARAVRSAPKSAAAPVRTAARAPERAKAPVRAQYGNGRRTAPVKKRKKEKYCWWAAPVIALSLVILAVAGLFVYQQIGAYGRYRDMRAKVESQTYYSGIYVDGISLAGATLEQALEHWAQNVEPAYAGRTVTVDLNGSQYTLTASDFGYASNYEEVLRQAFELGRGGDIESRYDEIQRIASEGADLAVERTIVDEALVQARIDELAATVNTGATDAHVTGFDAQTLTFTFAEGEAGYAVDESALKSQVLAAFASGGGSVSAQVSLVQPTTTVAELSAKYGLIDSATTNASSSSSNRLSNIALACSTINGLRLDPDETFSFNGVLGKRTTEKGYKSAPAFVNGLVEEDVGGGICQVSTTLFNAAVKADMTVVERSPHSRPVSYVDRGKDAAVNWPDTDLKFRNDSQDPIWIVAEVTENKRVVISIYGKLFENGGSIIIEAKTTETLEPDQPEMRPNSSLAPGEQVIVEDARTGYRAEAYKVYLDADGNEISREPLCRSTYRASGGVIEYGPTY